MKSLLRSYLEDSFAWGCPVCKTAEEELCQLQGKVREKGQIPHNVWRETLKSRDTQISRSHTDYRKRERRQTFHFKRVPQPGISHNVLWCYSSTDPQTSQHAVYMLNILFLWNSLEHTMLMCSEPRLHFLMNLEGLVYWRHFKFSSENSLTTVYISVM